MTATPMNSDQAIALFSYFISASMLSLAAYTGVKAWSSIQQIQAQGIIGQAFNQEAYEAATTQLTLAVVLILVGFVLAISAAAYHVSGKLEEIS